MQSNGRASKLEMGSRRSRNEPIVWDGAEIPSLSASFILCASASLRDISSLRYHQNRSENQF
jgi:hypothetical protein